MPQPHIHKNISNSIRRVIHDTRNLSDNPTYGISKRLLASALAIVAGSAVAVGCASAEGSVEFSLTVPDTPVLEVVIQGTDAEGDINLSMAPTMAKADFNTADVAVTVGTSSTAGYNLKMAVGNSGQLISGGNSIPSLAAAEDENGDPYSCTKATKLTCNFTVNSWGYWMTGDTANNYKPIPSAETELANYTTGAMNGVTTELEFGVRVNAKQAGGDYQTTINFIATANPEPVDNISKVKNMQDFAMLSAEEYTAVLDTMTTGQSYQLTDSRDGTVYNVGKLNGKIWMLDNLALGGSSAMTLDSTNTNLADNTTYILPASGTVCFTKSNCTGTDGTTTGTGYTVAAINADYKTTTSANNTDFTYNSNGDVSKSGVYYNYCAASAGTYCYAENAGTGNASYDICPKGWRLPTGGSNANTSEFRSLANNLGNVTSGDLTGDAYTNFKTAFHAGLSGYFISGSVQDQTSKVFFWSSTRYDGYSMYRLLLDTSTVSPQSYGDRFDGRFLGLSVRCVLKPYAYDMQNVSAETMDSILPTNGSTYVMKDNRDGTEYAIGKLADGNYWMLDNLALDPSAQELNSSNTNVTSTVTTTFENKTSGWNNTSPNNAYEKAYFNLASKDIQVIYNGGGNTKVGGYYNYCAASAGTYCYAKGASPDNTNATSDICPAGWKMPNGDQAKGSYYYLYNAGYSGNVSNFNNALHAGFSGKFWDSSASDQGFSGVNGVGCFWSATLYSGSNMYYLAVNALSVSPQSNYPRNYGYSVRCVLNSN